MYLLRILGEIKTKRFNGSSTFSMVRRFSIQDQVGFYKDIHTKQRRDDLIS